jgi:phosphoenolpyruvate---glycerone phosphotransferase subunit DhaK
VKNITSMKKLINGVDVIVDEECAGLAAAHPALVRFNRDPRFLARAGGATTGKPALVSGGGSGHEPLHGGYVGYGMLDAACPGEVFTSPVPDQMYASAKAVGGGAGVLFIVKNYTGDIMNFELAAEMLEGDGVNVRSVVVADDVAVKDSLYTTGRRGVGTTVFVERIAGAAAERKLDLAEVERIAKKTSDAGRSMGLALTSCTVPAKGSPTFELGDDEMEVGIGIHGEPGRERTKLRAADAIVDTLYDPVASDLGLRRGDRVLVMLNGMGGTPLIELYLAYNRLAERLSSTGVSVVDALVGNYITSLEMQGCSITVVRVDDELERLWKTPVHTPALRWGM